MASSSTLTFSCSCSSFSYLSSLGHNSTPFPLYNKPNLSFSPSSLSLNSLSLSSSTRPTPTPISSPFVVNSSETEALVVDSEPPKSPPPKTQEVFAVVMVGSRQYIVIPGRWIYTQRLKGANVDDKIVLNKVLLVGTKNSTYVGKPIVTNAVVHAVVEEQTLDKKVVVFKYKKKKNYRRNIGHRQPITRIKITAITGYEDYPASTLDS